MLFYSKPKQRIVFADRYSCIYVCDPLFVCVFARDVPVLYRLESERNEKLLSFLFFFSLKGEGLTLLSW